MAGMLESVGLEIKIAGEVVLSIDEKIVWLEVSGI